MDFQGQRISAMNRIHLAAHLPTLLVWGAHDPFIPVSHAIEALGRIPNARLEIFERSGHFPQAEEPQRFTRLLTEFITTTTPAPKLTSSNRAALRSVVEAAPASRRPAPARPASNLGRPSG
jgi:hypothetical protein